MDCEVLLSVRCATGHIWKWKVTTVLVPPAERVSYSEKLPRRLEQKHPQHWSREKSGGM